MIPARALLAALALILGMAPANAEEWKSVSKDQGVELAYQAAGNMARLRFANTGSQPMTVRWKLLVHLGTGKDVDNQGELNLAAGETEVVASVPYRDAGHPAEVKGVSGTIAAKKAAP